MKLNKIVYVLKELALVRSPGDLKIFYDKLPLWLHLAFQDRKDRRKPLILQIEPTNQCNLRCISCPQDILKRKKGYMDFGLFQKIIDEAAGIGIKRIWLFMQGESLLHPQIINMVRYIKQRKIGIDLTTNGMLLDSSISRALLEAGMNSADYITVSILGYSKQVHEAVMRGANHEKVEKNIENLMELRKGRKTSGPLIQTIFYSMPENQHEIDAYQKRWKGVVDRPIAALPISRSWSNKEDISKLPQRRTVCLQAWERMTIYWNGDVTVCNHDIHGEHVFGNLRTQSIKELWNCKAFNDFRKMHKEGKLNLLPMCSNCDA